VAAPTRPLRLLRDRPGPVYGEVQQGPAGDDPAGYVQIETPAIASQSKHIALKYPNGTPILDGTGAQVYAEAPPSYLGPAIVAQSNRPVRVEFTNYLPPTPQQAPQAICSYRSTPRSWVPVWGRSAWPA